MDSMLTHWKQYKPGKIIDLTRIPEEVENNFLWADHTEDPSQEYNKNGS